MYVSYAIILICVCGVIAPLKNQQVKWIVVLFNNHYMNKNKYVEIKTEADRYKWSIFFNKIIVVGTKLTSYIVVETVFIPHIISHKSSYLK